MNEIQQKMQRKYTYIAFPRLGPWNESTEWGLKPCKSQTNLTHIIIQIKIKDVKLLSHTREFWGMDLRSRQTSREKKDVRVMVLQTLGAGGHRNSREKREFRVRAIRCCERRDSRVKGEAWRERRVWEGPMAVVRVRVWNFFLGRRKAWRENWDWEPMESWKNKMKQGASRREDKVWVVFGH